MNTSEEELELINIQNIVTYVFIGALIVSLLISYNKKLKLSNQAFFWSDEEVKSISVTTRVITLLAIIVEIYVTLKNKEILSKKANISKEDLESADIQIVVAFLALIASLLVIYAVLNTSDAGLSNVENPEL